MLLALFLGCIDASFLVVFTSVSAVLPDWYFYSIFVSSVFSILKSLPAASGSFQYRQSLHRLFAVSPSSEASSSADGVSVRQILPVSDPCRRSRCFRRLFCRVSATALGFCRCFRFCRLAAVSLCSASSAAALFLSVLLFPA